MTIALEANTSRDERVKGEKGRKKFGYKITNNSREVLLLHNKNGKKVLADEIFKDVKALKKLDVFQFYPPKNNFQKKYSCQYALINMIFDVKQK